ncbi:hypothetical protein ACK6SE_03330 [Enterobacter ludwigii]|uniref:hypothetical protein n=1 Tax=Enterobacter ludwigii TaxID=299767 RepID=UPI003C2EEA07
METFIEKIAMAKKIGVLFKVFSREDYKEGFLDGHLYMNTIDYFRKYEEELDGNIADKFEALTGWFQPHDVILTLEVNGEKLTLNPDDMAGPTTISMKKHDHANVYCMTQLHSHDIDMSRVKGEEEERRLRQYFTLPKESENLGAYLVIIVNPAAFLERVRLAVQGHVEKNEVYAYQAKQVIYYDENKTSLTLKNDMEAPFYKQSKYSHQSEFRLCLLRDNVNNKPFTLNIGSIRDIATEIRTEEFNSLIEIKRN